MNRKQTLASVIVGIGIFTAAQAQAYEQGDIIVRAGPTQVNPDNSSNGPLRLGGTELAGTSVTVEDDTQLGFTLTYMFSDSLGISLLASTPFEHDIKESGVGVDEVGSTKHLPPTLTIQYYPDFGSEVFKPYLGAGLNYTTFFSEKASPALNTALGNASVSLDDSFGLALELGADFSINEKWGINAAVWMLDIDTDASISTDAGLVEVGVAIDPTVYTLGLSYKF